MVSSSTLVPVQKKMDKILQLSVPVKKKEVRRLLGLVNYYRHFIANFASISAPLSDLLRKGTPKTVKWTPRCDQSLAEIKRLFSSLQRHLAFNHFILQTDHKPLSYPARLMRWALALQEFLFQVAHIPGSENLHADVLSRLC
ncbi:transposon ty3-g Gag-Pol polyprotein [Plakobranchus ocellatus]|uniref:Transposon ty3-g Gag-Pol polyprotein n=1 Tax=Plakobranchus ocellatus TaxID=259542 RepID=A0AAV3Y4Q6_9GAST|nr:transposon ty3-g Gag-Pol polyprotein [Plakobranchus ocellatus]